MLLQEACDAGFTTDWSLCCSSSSRGQEYCHAAVAQSDFARRLQGVSSELLPPDLAADCSRLCVCTALACTCRVRVVEERYHFRAVGSRLHNLYFQFCYDLCDSSTIGGCMCCPFSAGIHGVSQPRPVTVGSLVDSEIVSCDIPSDSLYVYLLY